MFKSEEIQRAYSTMRPLSEIDGDGYSERKHMSLLSDIAEVMDTLRKSCGPEAYRQAETLIGLVTEWGNYYNRHCFQEGWLMGQAALRGEPGYTDAKSGTD